MVRVPFSGSYYMIQNMLSIEITKRSIFWSSALEVAFELGKYKQYSWQGLLTYDSLKSVCIRSFSGQYFPELISLYSVRMRENTDQKNCEYGHFSRSVLLLPKGQFVLLLTQLTRFNLLTEHNLLAMIEKSENEKLLKNSCEEFVFRKSRSSHRKVFLKIGTLQFF